MSASVAISNSDYSNGHLRRFFFGLALFFSALLFLLFCFYPEGRAQTDPGNFLLGIDSPVAPDNTDQRSPAISGSIALWSEDSAGVFYKDLSRGPDEPKHALIDGDGGGGGQSIVSRPTGPSGPNGYTTITPTRWERPSTTRTSI